MSAAERAAEGYVSERPSARPNGIPRSPVVVGFAPFGRPVVCVSRAGRARGAHDLDRDGNCHWCSFPLENFSALEAEAEADALSGGSPELTALLPTRNGRLVAEPQGHGLIPPPDPAARQPGPSSLPSAERRAAALAGVRKRRHRGRELVFSPRAFAPRAR